MHIPSSLATWLRQQAVGAVSLAVRIVLAVTLIMGGYAIYAYSTLPHVNNGDPLTASTWNTMIDTINQHSTQLSTFADQLGYTHLQCTSIYA